MEHERKDRVVDHDVLIIEKVQRNGLNQRKITILIKFLSLIHIIMSIKAAKIIYRVTTIALALFILPGLFYMNSEMAVAGMKHV